MMVKCDICSIILSENDVPSHNNGKKHLKNLGKMKLELASIKRTVINTCTNDQKEIDLEKLTTDEKEENIVKESDALTKKKEESETPPKKEKESDALTKKEEESDAPKKIEEVKITGRITNSKPKDSSEKKNQKPSSEIQKGRPKRKLKDDLPKAPLVPDVFINNNVSFEQQVINFIMQVEQGHNDWLNIRKVLRDVEFVFGQVIPNVRPVLYGSSFSGLAFKTSDIDVYLFDSSGAEQNRNFVQHEGSIIYKYRLFKNVVRIPNARVPVIKATHIETGIDLDISATSGQAVANSRMLRFLLSHDWRIRSLMMLLGYLGKKFTLIGVNKFSRYSINLLIIFYLQSLEIQILPPLCHIVYGTQGRTWPFAFKENPYALMNRNRQSLAELFIGFFKFYVNFPFSHYIVSTYLGEKIAINDMEKGEILDKMIHYKQYINTGGEKIVYRCICVQDPLELCHNTTKGITEKVLSHFKFICENALQVIGTVTDKDWLIEMLKMEHIPPYPDKLGNGPLSFNVKYNYSGDDWIACIKPSLELIFDSLKMDIDWKCPLADYEAKKTKLSPGLSFSIETKIFFFPKSLKWNLNQFKLGNFNLKQLKKSIIDTSENKHRTVFSAQCFISLDQPNILRFTMKSNCNYSSFSKTYPVLKNHFENLLNHASVNQKTEEVKSEQ